MRGETEEAPSSEIKSIMPETRARNKTITWICSLLSQGSRSFRVIDSHSADRTPRIWKILEALIGTRGILSSQQENNNSTAENYTVMTWDKSRITTRPSGVPRAMVFPLEVSLPRHFTGI